MLANPPRNSLTPEAAPPIPPVNAPNKGSPPVANEVAPPKSAPPATAAAVPLNPIAVPIAVPSPGATILKAIGNAVFIIFLRPLYSCKPVFGLTVP